MTYSYDRSGGIKPKSASDKEGPISKVLGKWWNLIHDLEDELEYASRDYDQAQSYGSSAGAKEAKVVQRSLDEAVKQIRHLTSGVFETLQEAEGKFVREHGLPSDFIRGQQDKAGFR